MRRRKELNMLSSVSQQIPKMYKEEEKNKEYMS
jgi:hypothetical protein